MTLQLQMLGTGSAFAKRYYNNNGLLYSGDFKLLIDCGITAPLSLHKLGIPLTEIDAILITHIHADHVGGLEEIAFRMKYEFGRKPVLYIAEALKKPLWDNTLKGGMSQEDNPSLEDFFEVRTLAEGAAYPIAPNLHIELMQTPHIPGKPSYSLYLNHEVFYSADMTFMPELLKQLVYNKNCRKILHEVQLTGSGEVHTTLEELLSLPEDIRKIICLMHYSDDMESFIGRTAEMTFLRQHEVYTL